MSACRTLTGIGCTLVALVVCGCSSVGPGSVPRDRIDYATAIGDSWKQQTLLNIVKLRYGDMPIFLEIAQVIANYQLESTLSAGFNAANNTRLAEIPVGNGPTRIVAGRAPSG